MSKADTAAPMLPEDWQDQLIRVYKVFNQQPVVTESSAPLHLSQPDAPVSLDLDAVALPVNWDEQVLRAYQTFDVRSLHDATPEFDEFAEFNLDAANFGLFSRAKAALRGARKYWTAEKLAEKARKQLRNSEGEWIASRGVNLPEGATIVNGKIRSSKHVLPGHDDPVGRLNVYENWAQEYQDYFERKTGNKLPPRHPAPRDPESVAQWLKMYDKYMADYTQWFDANNLHWPPQSPSKPTEPAADAERARVEVQPTPKLEELPDPPPSASENQSPRISPKQDAEERAEGEKEADKKFQEEIDRKKNDEEELEQAEQDITAEIERQEAEDKKEQEKAQREAEENQSPAPEEQQQPKPEPEEQQQPKPEPEEQQQPKPEKKKRERPKPKGRGTSEQRIDPYEDHIDKLPASDNETEDERKLREEILDMYQDVYDKDEENREIGEANREASDQIAALWEKYIKTPPWQKWQKGRIKKKIDALNALNEGRDFEMHEKGMAVEEAYRKIKQPLHAKLEELADLKGLPEEDRWWRNVLRGTPSDKWWRDEDTAADQNAPNPDEDESGKTRELPRITTPKLDETQEMPAVDVEDIEKTQALPVVRDIPQEPFQDLDGPPLGLTKDSIPGIRLSENPSFKEKVMRQKVALLADSWRKSKKNSPQAKLFKRRFSDAVQDLADHLGHEGKQWWQVQGVEQPDVPRMQTDDPWLSMTKPPEMDRNHIPGLSLSKDPDNEEAALRESLELAVEAWKKHTGDTASDRLQALGIKMNISEMMDQLADKVGHEGDRWWKIDESKVPSRKQQIMDKVGPEALNSIRDTGNPILDGVVSAIENGRADNILKDQQKNVERALEEIEALLDLKDSGMSPAQMVTVKERKKMFEQAQSILKKIL